VGSMANPGVPLLVIEDTSRFRVEAYVDERLSSKLKIGMPVHVVPDTTGQRMAGTVTEIAPAVDPASRTFLIKIDLKEPSLRSGLYVRVMIPEGKRKALLVPRDAVVEKGQLTGVYTVDEKGVIAYRLIKTGKLYDGRVEVFSGLKAGESIVVSDTDKAIDGGVMK